jgi:DNA-binding Lrp family transcriptional regulator
VCHCPKRIPASGVADTTWGKRMTTAYVLINCELGSEERVFSQLKAISKIKETRGVFGAYDIVTKIEASSADLVNDIIVTKIRGMDRIRSTLTLMGSEKETQD